MAKYEMIFDYRDNKHYNNELITLIKKESSKSSFEAWMTRHRWDENYIPFALINERGDIVVNIGVMKMNVIFNNNKYQAIQLIGRMVRRGYEHLDLDKQLADMIVEKYENIVDAIYTYDEGIKPLLKDEPGFEVLKEHVYTKRWDPTRLASGVIVKKLDIESNKGLDILYYEIKHSTRLSPILWTSGDASIKVYNIVKHFRRNVYFIPSKNVLVIFQINDDIFTLISVYSKANVDLKELLDILVPQGIRKVVFAFTPDWDLDELKMEAASITYHLGETATRDHNIVIKFITRPFVMQSSNQIVFPMLARGR